MPQLWTTREKKWQIPNALRFPISTNEIPSHDSKEWIIWTSAHGDTPSTTLRLWPKLTKCVLECVNCSAPKNCPCLMPWKGMERWRDVIGASGSTRTAAPVRVHSWCGRAETNSAWPEAATGITSCGETNDFNASPVVDPMSLRLWILHRRGASFMNSPHRVSTYVFKSTTLDFCLTRIDPTILLTSIVQNTKPTFDRN